MSKHTSSVESLTAGRKLGELRAKTDRDVAILLGRALDHGFQAISQADYAHAEAVYAGAAQLLPLVSGLPPWECAPLRTRLRALRAALDEAVMANACLAS